MIFVRLFDIELIVVLKMGLKLVKCLVKLMLIEKFWLFVVNYVELN